MGSTASSEVWNFIFIPTGPLCELISWLCRFCNNNVFSLCWLSVWYSRSRLVAGFGASIALILLEFTTFILGLTMFSTSVSLLFISSLHESFISLPYDSSVAEKNNYISLDQGRYYSYGFAIGSHGLASVILTYFVVDGWLCDWFWMVFAFCSVLPSVVDTVTAIATIFTAKW